MQAESRLDILRMLLGVSDSPPELDAYVGPKDGFSILQQNTDPLYYGRPLEDRLSTAFCIARESTFLSPGLGGPDLLQSVLGESSSSAHVVSSTTNGGETVLHLVACMIGYLTSLLFYDNLGSGSAKRPLKGKDINRPFEDNKITLLQTGGPISDS